MWISQHRCNMTYNWWTKFGPTGEDVNSDLKSRLEELDMSLRVFCCVCLHLWNFLVQFSSQLHLLPTGGSLCEGFLYR